MNSFPSLRRSFVIPTARELWLFAKGFPRLLALRVLAWQHCRNCDREVSPATRNCSPFSTWLQRRLGSQMETDNRDFFLSRVCSSKNSESFRSTWRSYTPPSQRSDPLREKDNSSSLPRRAFSSTQRPIATP